MTSGYTDHVKNLRTIDPASVQHSFIGSLHWLFNDVANNPNVNNKVFAERIQEYYFDKVKCYRGDLIKSGPSDLLQHIHVKMAVSNWQGN